MSRQALEQSKSPYIRLHKDNPVAWRLWGPEALAEAVEKDKPIFLSLGYTACHWCHVMNGESFMDDETAALLNENFIPILVDREERPDIDQLYQAAAQMMQHSGGWPLSMYLTPDAKPYFAAGYIPKEEKSGQLSFKQLTGEIAQVFLKKRNEVNNNSEAVRAQLDYVYNRDMRAEIESVSLDLAALRIAQRFDIFFGGVQGDKKFPHPTLLDLMWRAYLRTGMTQYSQVLFVSLDNMLFAGLYDHVGGGFFRYCTDERWLFPHFEKMLYDNALMVEMLTTVWQSNRNELSRIRVSETVEWLMREMRVGSAFAAGLDSNSEGEEGKFYLWTEAEIDAALKGTFSAKFKQSYGVTKEGNFAGGRTILRRLGRANATTEADESLLTRQRKLLLEARDRRVRPTRDDKVLADWNGLAIAALAHAGAAFERPEWVQAAIAAFDQIVSDLGTGNRLQHCAGINGFADDYANMARAALRLWEVTGDRKYLTKARGWAEAMNDFFWNDALGGYCISPSDGESLIVRARVLMDNPAPTANGTMLEVLSRLSLAYHDTALGQRASELLKALGDEAGRQFISSGAFLNGIEYFANAAQIVVVGPRSSARTQDLLRTIWSKSLPTKLLIQVESTDELPDNHPVKGKQMEGGLPTVFIVQRGMMAEPITSAVTLSQFLTLPVQRAAQPQQPAPQKAPATVN